MPRIEPVSPEKSPSTFVRNRKIASFERRRRSVKLQSLEEDKKRDRYSERPKNSKIPRSPKKSLKNSPKKSLKKKMNKDVDSFIDLLNFHSEESVADIKGLQNESFVERVDQSFNAKIPVGKAFYLREDKIEEVYQSRKEFQIGQQRAQQEIDKILKKASVDSNEKFVPSGAKIQNFGSETADEEVEAVEGMEVGFEGIKEVYQQKHPSRLVFAILPNKLELTDLKPIVSFFLYPKKFTILS